VKRYKEWKKEIEEKRRIFELWIERYFAFAQKISIDWKLHYCEAWLIDGVIVENKKTYYYEYITDALPPQPTSQIPGGMGCEEIEKY